MTGFLIGDGYGLDLYAAVTASPFALGLLANTKAKPGSQQAAVRTAILRARLKKA